MNNGGQNSLIRLTDPPLLDSEVRLPAESMPALEAWQVRPGEILTAVDSQNRFYRVRMTNINQHGAVCVPFAECRRTESALDLQVYQALPDKERFELILEKLTELGAMRIVPMETGRSSTLVERDSSQKKSHRWPAVVRKAARQCRRAMLPELFETVDFRTALSESGQAELKFMLYEGEGAWPLKTGIGRLRPESAALLVGPEGGFEPDEVIQARNAGFLPVTLGPRILRTETAAIAAASLIQGFIGDLGQQ